MSQDFQERHTTSVARIAAGEGDQARWREFDEGEEWFAGRALWVWAPSWQKPRLITADRGDDFDWFFASGPHLHKVSWEFPTHCCDPVPPVPPVV